MVACDCGDKVGEQVSVADDIVEISGAWGLRSRALDRWIPIGFYVCTLFEIGDDLLHGLTGDYVDIRDQRGLPGACDRYHEAFPPELERLYGHWKHAVGCDQRSGGADSSHHCDILPILPPWNHLGGFDEHPDQHGQVQVCSPLLYVARTEVDHHFLDGIGIAEFLCAGLHPVLGFLDRAVAQSDNGGRL